MPRFGVINGPPTVFITGTGQILPLYVKIGSQIPIKPLGLGIVEFIGAHIPI